MNRMTFFFAFFFSLVLFALPVQAAEPEAASGLAVINLKIGSATARTELAKTEEERAKGLMFRKTLDKDAGMLFDFGRPARVCMWMKNTYVPLSVAFIDKDGIIVNIEDMTPLSTRSHCSSGYVVYALEMNRGWFAAKKIRAGNRVKDIPKSD